MPYDNAPTTEQLLRKIRELERFREERTDSIHEIPAELVRLQEQLGPKEFRFREWSVLQDHRAGLNNPN